jgi:hypothetical protein
MTASRNHLEEWVWRMDELRQMIDIQGKSSPFGRSERPAEQIGPLPKRSWKRRGESVTAVGAGRSLRGLKPSQVAAIAVLAADPR